MDIIKRKVENILSLPVALILENTTNVDNAVDHHNSGNTTDGILEQSVSNGKSFTGSSLEKVGELIRKELKWGFILHTYGFGCLFFILAFYTFFSVLNLRSFISSRPFMSTINGFLCLLGASRATSLLIDPYNLKEAMPKILGQILWDLGFPSVISAFCLVQLAFLQLTQLKIGPESLRKKSCLSLIVAAHFMLTIGMDIVVTSHENLQIIKYIIQYAFLGWGVMLCCSFLYSGYKVMSMIRNIPGGFRHRNLPDPNHKGIMQLAMLAPHNNLAGSVTAALLPTLCAPKIHQQDNTSTSTLGFRNEGNSRILESESIPILEEMAGSSGDERSSQPLVRGSSFQNQTRNTQKFNLKPKLSLKSSPESDQIEDRSEKLTSPSATKSQTPKSPPSRFASPRVNRFDFPIKSSNGLSKAAEPFVTTKSLQEFKSKIHNRGGSETDHSPSSCDKKVKNGSEGKKFSNQFENVNNLVPDILISTASRSNSFEINPNAVTEKVLEQVGSITDNDQAASPFISHSTEIKTELRSQFWNHTKKDKTYLNIEIQGKSKKQKNGDKMNRKGCCSSINSKRTSESSRKSSQLGDSGSRWISCRRDSIKEDNTLMVEMCTTRRSSDSSAASETYESNELYSPSMRDKKKAKALSWKNKGNEDRTGIVQQCPSTQESTTRDVSLSAILNHIAYVNRAALTADTATQEELEKVRKSKVEWVLNVTYITAMWGLMLCLSNMGRIYSPYGIPEPNFAPISSSLSNSTMKNGVKESTNGGILSSPWPWLWFQTFCRALELAMGCAMANITRQPTATYRNPHSLSIRHRDTLYNI